MVIEMISQLHQWAPLLNSLLLIGVFCLLAILIVRTKLISALSQSARIGKIETRVFAIESKTESANHGTVRLRRDMEASLEGVVGEVRRVGSRVEEILSDRHLMGEVDSRTIALEQMYQDLGASVSLLIAETSEIKKNISELACAEVEWHASEIPPSICPLYKTPCPLSTPSPSISKEAE